MQQQRNERNVGMNVHLQNTVRRMEKKEGTKEKMWGTQTFIRKIQSVACDNWFPSSINVEKRNNQPPSDRLYYDNAAPRDQTERAPSPAVERVINRRRCMEVLKQKYSVALVILVRPPSKGLYSLVQLGHLSDP